MQFYTVADLKKLLKLSASQVYALIESGKLRCHRFTTKKSGAVRVSQEQLDDYLRETESAGAAAEAPPRHLH
jgi:excisionase family DNA binding protein